MFRSGTLAGISKILSFARPPRWTVIAVPAAIILVSALSILPPLFIGRIIDALDRHSLTAVLQHLGLYCLTMGVVGGVQFASGYAATVFRESQVRNLRTAFVIKLNTVALDALAKFDPGQIKNRIVGDVEALSLQMQYGLFPTVTSLVTLVATIAALVRLDVRFAIISVTLSLLTLVPMRLAARRVATLSKQEAEAKDDLYGALQEGVTVQGVALFRNPMAASQRLKHLGTISERIFGLNIAESLLGQCTDLASTLLSMLGPAAVLAVGAYLVIKGNVTPGIVVTALIYQSRIATPFGTLSSLQSTFAALTVVVTRLLEIFDLPDESSGDRQFAPGRLIFRDVELTRDGRAALRGVTLSVEPTTHIAIIGPSGAGKSTLASLIPRLSDPVCGKVEIGDVDVGDFTLDSLRRAIAIVPQDSLLLDATLVANLTLMQPDASDDEIALALKDSVLEELVDRLPNGIMTRLGHRGFRLSGGERQRVCLARALLQNPKLLILDEALSGVDIETERIILGRIRRRLRDRMMIVITHRVISAEGFDRVVAMESGRIVNVAGLTESAGRNLSQLP
ncbi:MAG: ABC transporter ATP-binding protein [Candidatus Eremiobacteraeota bacterium]|nr:ABC transporter ATP-binding protein [Candidatus Eremiobacteraeota bacterium]